MAATIWQRRWLVLGAIVACFVLMLIFLNLADYRYTAGVKLTVPASNNNGLSSSLGGLSGLASVANVRLPQSKGEQNFLVLTNDLDSPLGARVLMRDPTIVQRVFYKEWDSNKKVWRKPPSLVGGIADGLKSLLGLPTYPYRAPDVARMQLYLSKRIDVSEDVRKPIVAVSYSHEDPAFAVKLLDMLVRGVDTELRLRALERTQNNIAYLSRQLQTVQLAESRNALAAALASEEREKMAASNASYYATEPMSTVGVSDKPTFPKPGLFLALSVVLGAAIGSALALLLGPKPRRL